jgi:hypothetical protein
MRDALQDIRLPRLPTMEASSHRWSGTIFVHGAWAMVGGAQGNVCAKCGTMVVHRQAFPVKGKEIAQLVGNSVT